MFDMTEFNRAKEEIKKAKNEVIEVKLKVGWTVNDEWFEATDHALYGKIAKITRDNLSIAKNFDTYIMIDDARYSIVAVTPYLYDMTELTLSPRFPIKVDIEII